jgi:hypothetical protein
LTNSSANAPACFSSPDGQTLHLLQCAYGKKKVTRPFFCAPQEPRNVPPIFTLMSWNYRGAMLATQRRAISGDLRLD